MPKFTISPVADSIPVDNDGQSFNSDTVQTVFQEFRREVVTEPGMLTSANSATDTLTVDDPTLQVVEGTGIGYAVQLPDATTLFEGRLYSVANATDFGIDIKDGSGASLFNLPASSKAELTLIDNATAAGEWLQVVVSTVATGVEHIIATSGVIDVISGSTPEIITGMEVTPSAGTWAVWFNSEMVIGSNNRLARAQIYVDGVAKADSFREIQGVSSNLETVISTLTTINVDGTQSVDVRGSVSSGNVTYKGRTLLLIRLGV